MSQHIPSDLSAASLAAASSATSDVLEHIGSGSGEARSSVNGCTGGTGAVVLGNGSDNAVGGEDDGAAGDGPAKVTLLQQLLMTSTQPSPLKAVFSVDEMEVNLSYF